VMLLLTLGKMSSMFVVGFPGQPLGDKRQIKTGGMSVFRPTKLMMAPRRLIFRRQRKK
jgi:hypothetical protein